MNDLRIRIRGWIMMCLLILGSGLVLSSCSNQEEEDRTALRALLDTYKKDRLKEEIGKVINKSPVLWFFRSFDIHCSGQSEKEESYCQSNKEKPFHEFIVDGSPTKEFLDLFSQLDVTCQKKPDHWGCHPPQDYHSPLKYRNDFPFLRNLITTQKDQDLLTFIQYQKSYCEQYKQDGKFCTNLYPINDQPIKMINDENIYPELTELLNADYW